MSWSPTTLDTIRKLNRAGGDVRDRFLARDTAVDLMLLAVLAQEHLLLLGPPGTAKTELIRRFAHLCHARPFHYLMTRFTEPSELFGALDVPAFREGRFVIRTTGMLPKAEIAFLDEVFLGSSAVLNTLLTLVNERLFHDGEAHQSVPLISLFGAANDIPDDPTLRAFSDRFLLRTVLEPVGDVRLGELLTLGWELETERLEANVATQPFLSSTDALRALTRQLPRVDLRGVRPLYEEAIRLARAEGVTLTDRRVVRCQRLVAAAAMLAEREAATAADLWPLRHIWSIPGEREPLLAIMDSLLENEGVPRANSRRELDDLVAELDDLDGREPTLKGETALGAQLRALGRLRRETLATHPTAADLCARIDHSIARLMARLGA